MTKFELNDEVDGSLIATLVHEMFLCTASFERFATLAEANIMGRRDKATKILCHDAYASFIHHLYEFYQGCVQRDKRDLSPVPWHYMDMTFNTEARKALRDKADAINGGYAPSWENHISVYQVEVPDEFGKQLRHIRNRTAHASIKRSTPGDQMPLADFYHAYHGFVYLLFRRGQWLWTVKDIEAHDWKAIEDFDLSVQSERT